MLASQALGYVPTDLDLMKRETPEATQTYPPTCWVFPCLWPQCVHSTREDGSALRSLFPKLKLHLFSKGLMLLPASQAACAVSVTTAVPEGHGNAVLTLQVTERTSEFPPDSTAYHRTINAEL